MSLQLSNLPLSIETSDADIPSALAQVLNVSPGDIDGWRILRKSLDVRNKRNIRFVYNFEVSLPQDEANVVARQQSQTHPKAQVQFYHDEPFVIPPPGKESLQHRPIVIGSGPAGLMCAYFLAKQGYRPIVLERGTRVSQRIRDVRQFDDGGKFEPESNYLFGEGGAGTFSDGKLTCRGTGPDVLKVLEVFAECKGQQTGKPSILYYHRPHLGSNRLPAVVKSMRQHIEAAGGEVHFNTRVTDFQLSGNRITGVTTNNGTFQSNVIVLAIGHSARDTFAMLAERGVPMTPKAFQFGVRIEHRQEVVNHVQFGPKSLEYSSILGNADYSLVAQGDNNLFTFCMCAGGQIIPSVSQEGYFCTNGMSLSRRDSPTANSGLVVTVPVSHFNGTDVLAGIRLQEQYESLAYEMGRGEYRAPLQSARDFLDGVVSRQTPSSSYPRETVNVNLEELLPPIVARAVRDGLPQMDRRWQGRFLKDATLAGPEARGSSPIRIDRDSDSRVSPTLPGLYPIGEGAGYAGGIVSAAVDGLRTAKSIIARYMPIDS